MIHALALGGQEERELGSVLTGLRQEEKPLARAARQKNRARAEFSSARAEPGNWR